MPNFSGIISNPVFLVGAGITLAVFFTLKIMHTAGLWGTLQKMGRHDFASIVPGYKTWEFCRGVGLGVVPTLIYLFLLIISLLAACYIFFTIYRYLTAPTAIFAFQNSLKGGYGAFVMAVLTEAYKTFTYALFDFEPLIVVAVVILLLCLLYTILILWGVARSFGRGVVWVLGVLFFPAIFYNILGWSKKKEFRGPYFERRSASMFNMDWPQLVAARKATFGSNAPLACAIMGMYLSAFFFVVPGIFLSIYALIRNKAEKNKPLAGAKHSVTTVVAFFGIAVAIVVGCGLFLMGGMHHLAAIIGNLRLPIFR